MTIEEIKNKAYNEVKKAQENYRDNINKYLEANNLRGEVIRVEDDKVGYLYVQSDYYTKLGYSVYFYPLKKDEEVKKPELVSEDNILEDFKPYTN